MNKKECTRENKILRKQKTLNAKHNADKQMKWIRIDTREQKGIHKRKQDAKKTKDTECKTQRWQTNEMNIKYLFFYINKSNNWSRYIPVPFYDTKAGSQKSK